MQYDFSLDMTTVNSNSVIASSIPPNSHILEIGCAYGRLTKFLAETKHCTIDIVEIDSVAGTQASKFAQHSFIGSISGDVSTEQCFNLVSNTESYYDYILFIDVLEHLMCPEKVLTKFSQLLKNNGKIWISIPNISHNAVLIDLLHDKFEYRETGLLDKTHIKFFTMLSLEKMIDECGLKVFKKHDLQNELQCTEFNNSYKDIPKEVANYLMKRRNGEVYQFVWGLEKK